jgi:hypothetical protein
MGVTYKLHPQVRELVLARKKTFPALSCRQLTSIIQEELQVKISKSSINTLLKEAGLSAAVGRRLKKKRRAATVSPPQVLLPVVETPAPAAPEPVKQAPPQPVLTEPPPVAQVLPTPAPTPPPAPAPMAPTPTAAAVIPQVSAQIPEIIPCLGALLLKAADCLSGGLRDFSLAVKEKLKPASPDILPHLERLLYSQEKLDPTFLLLGQPAGSTPDLSGLAQVRNLSADLWRVVSNAFQEARCIEIVLQDGNTLCLDAQLHTVWSSPHIPYDFCSPFYNTRQYVEKYFQQPGPFILFMAPGYDAPTKDFFDLLLSFDPPSPGKRISKIVLYGNNLEELEAIRLTNSAQRQFIFALWPWQFTQFRQVKSLGEFRPYTFAALGQEFYLAEAEIALSQPNAAQALTLRGAALKRSTAEKTKLVILSNLPADTPAEEIARLYLEHWPNPEETFQDHSRKVELFTYTASARRFFSAQNLSLGNQGEDIPGLLHDYLRVLDLYARWHFLPTGYEEEDFAAAQERFYSLGGTAKLQGNYLRVKLIPPPGYLFLKDLNYALRRLNEREILAFGDQRLWLESAF